MEIYLSHPNPVASPRAGELSEKRCGNSRHRLAPLARCERSRSGRRTRADAVASRSSSNSR